MAVMALPKFCQGRAEILQGREDGWILTAQQCLGIGVMQSPLSNFRSELELVAIAILYAL